ncbi:hypothetical protein A4E84_15170 [Streptomyces qaidamensis]|uniref:Uncharacterized protein n=1 Tax=Streptomyces qaidamensis TaxID=1783515 RepID=A0A143C0V1_9ACTN|nr:hypothetical protein [Streptomyces qaidamensis]AMW10729.1 hypothetical protein A4E84_15170 [Streptomyces qaidamensis]
MLSLDRIRGLLRELDDPEHLEIPQHYDLPAARDRFTRLTSALKVRYGQSATPGMPQDASYYGAVSVPASATGTDRPLWVLMSNFGPFVTAGTGRDGGMPGCEEGLTEEFLIWLDELCTELGCVHVPVTLLLEPYDGRAQLEPPEEDEEVLRAWAAAEYGFDPDEDEDEELPLAWWDRYFQYM